MMIFVNAVCSWCGMESAGHAVSASVNLYGMCGTVGGDAVCSASLLTPGPGATIHMS